MFQLVKDVGRTKDPAVGSLVQPRTFLVEARSLQQLGRTNDPTPGVGSLVELTLGEQQIVRDGRFRYQM